MGFGDHLSGVSNAKSIFINTQEGYARLEKEAKAQNKELVFVGNFHVKIVPKRNIFEKITDFFRGEIKAEKRALKDFKVSLPNIKQNTLDVKSAIRGTEADEIARKTRRAASTFQNTYAKQSESVSRGEIRSTIRDRQAATRSDRTKNGILSRDGISESANTIKTQLKEQYHLKPKDFNLGKPLETIGEESEEEISENALQAREPFRNAFLEAIDKVKSSSGSLEHDGQEYRFSDEQLEVAANVAADLSDNEVNFEKVFSKLEQGGIKLEGPLAQFVRTPEQLAELRIPTTSAKAEAPVASAPQSTSARSQELAANIKSKLSILLQVYPSTYPDAPAAQLAQVAQLKDELFSDKYNNPDDTLKLEALESAFQKAGINIDEGLFPDIGELVRELKTQ